MEQKRDRLGYWLAALLRRVPLDKQQRQRRRGRWRLATYQRHDLRHNRINLRQVLKFLRNL